MKNEKDVKAEIRRVLDSFTNIFYYMPVPTGYGVRGIPDFIVCLEGDFIGIEAKFGNNKESLWQKKQGAAITASWGLYLVVNNRNVAELRGILEDITPYKTL